MRFYLRLTAFVFVLVIIHSGSLSQSLSNYGSSVQTGTVNKKSNATIAGTWEAGVKIGPDFYYGDLNLDKFLPHHSFSVAGGVFIMRQFTNVVGIKANLLFGGLNGSKDGIYGTEAATWTFHGSMFNFTVSPVFNLSNMFSPYHEGRKVFLYASVGIGVNVWNRTLSTSLNGEVINPGQVQGMQAAFVFPVSLGLQYLITSRISAGIENTLSTVFLNHADQALGGCKVDFTDLFAFTASYRWGASKKNIAVQEYPYTSPVSYQTYTPPMVPPAVKPVPERIPPPSASEVYDYVVQVCAFTQHNYTIAWVKKHYHIDLPVTKESENGMNRYIIAHYYKDINSARELCDRLRKQGIHDAWIIAYQNGIRHHVVVY